MALPLRDNAPGYEVPVVNLSIILVCILVFLIQYIYPGGLEASRAAWGEVPTRILSGENIPGTNIPAWFTMFTNMWMHADLGHLFGNMYALWLFGDNVEWVMGRARYILFYIFCGLLSSVATTLLGFQSSEAGLGASGAIFGVLGAYLICYPRAKISSLIFVGPSLSGYLIYGTIGFTIRNISAFWWMGSYIVFQLITSFFLLGTGAWLNLGIYAHAAGALAGIGLTYLLRLPNRMPKPDHHTQSDDLTMPFIGEHGDAGSSYEPVNSLGKELSRLHSIHDERSTPLPELHDYRVDDLIASGRISDAVQHCLDMREVAYENDDGEKIYGYSQLIKKLHDQLAEQRHMSSPIVQPEPEPEKPEIASYSLLDPSSVTRGTRRKRANIQPPPTD